MNFQLYFNGKITFLQTGRVPSPIDHSARKFIIWLQNARGVVGL